MASATTTPPGTTFSMMVKNARLPECCIPEGTLTLMEGSKVVVNLTMRTGAIKSDSPEEYALDGVLFTRDQWRGTRKTADWATIVVKGALVRNSVAVLKDKHFIVLVQKGALSDEEIELSSTGTIEKQALWNSLLLSAHVAKKQEIDPKSIDRRMKETACIGMIQAVAPPPIPSLAAGDAKAAGEEDEGAAEETFDPSKEYEELDPAVQEFIAWQMDGKDNLLTYLASLGNTVVKPTAMRPGE